jgi:hypothetical protein
MNSRSIQGYSSNPFFQRFRLQRGLAFGVIIITALLAFELFNYSTTDFALTDLLGDLQFVGIRWATILSIAFCGIDFAGIARLFTPEEGGNEPNEVWYLFGAWLLAATMNAMLTWWGVSLAVLGHETLGNEVVQRETLLRIVPIFVAVLVWLIRVLIIGTFSVAGERLFSQEAKNTANGAYPRVAQRPSRSLGSGVKAPRSASSSRLPRPAPKPKPAPQEPSYSRPEPTYHPLMSAPAKTGSHNSQSRSRYAKNAPSKRGY